MRTSRLITMFAGGWMAQPPALVAIEAGLLQPGPRRVRAEGGGWLFRLAADAGGGTAAKSEGC